MEKKLFWPTLSLLMIWIAITGLIYPLLMTFIGQTFFPHSANGSLIIDHGKTKGSELIGQSFNAPHYFWGRPSATTPSPYLATASSGSNLSITNPEFLKTIQSRIDVLKKADPENKTKIPIDLITASGSGLDPHISYAGAIYQIPRVAKARNMPQDSLAKIVDKYLEGSEWYIFGEPRVNVLLLNRDLDSLPKGR